MNNNEILLGVVIKDPLNGKTGEHGLKEGEKVINSNEEIFKVFTNEEVKQICEETGCFFKKPPITITYLLEQDHTVVAHEARSRMFNSLEDIKEFLKLHQGLAICSIIERTDECKFMLRYYGNIQYKNSLHEKLDSNFYDINFVLDTIKEQFGNDEHLRVREAVQKVLREELMKLI